VELLFYGEIPTKKSLLKRIFGLCKTYFLKVLRPIVEEVYYRVKQFLE